MNRTVLLSLLISALLMAGVSCGGGAGTIQPDAVRDVQGITEGGFNLIRYSDAGPATDALNPTLDLAVQPAGSTTTVTIAIDDAQPTQGVTVDLNYDASRYTPVNVEFAGLIDTEVELAVTRLSGVVAIGQVATAGPGTRAGQFATVTFRNEPNRTISAVGDAHDRSIDSQYTAGGLTADGFDAVGDAGGFTYNILGIFTSLSGDGNQDGASNIADLTPLGAMLQRQVTATDGVSARADYDGNGLPNISDLTPLGANLGEATTQIELLAGDTTDVGAMTVVATLDWTAGDPPLGPAAITGDPNEIWRQWNGAIDAATAGPIDDAGNDDDHIFVSARAITSGTGVDQAGFTPPVDVTLGGIPPSNFLVQDVVFEINGVEVNDGDTVSLEANTAVTLEVVSFTGLYNGVAFTSGDVGTTVPQAEYNDELESIQNDFAANVAATASQTLNPGGQADFETNYEGVLIDFNTTGTPVNATVFPDDQDLNPAEGNLRFTFTNGNNQSDDVTVTEITLDVTADPNAPLVTDVRGNAGQNVDGDWIITNTDPDIRGTLQFPGGVPAFDDANIDVKLIDLTNNVELPVDFDFTLTPPTQAGTFNVVLSPTPGDYDFIVRVPAGSFNENNRYMVRFFSPENENPSSVNKPGEFLTGGTVPSGFDSDVLPRPTIFWDAASPERVIAIIPNDPQIRRNPQQDYDILGGNVTEVYPGFDDVLKSGGDFFSIEIVDGKRYPEVVVAAGNDPTVILAGDEQSIVLQTETSPHRLVVDLAGLDVPATTTFAYKVFGAPVIPGDLTSRPVITDGTFTANVDPAIYSPINGIDFGINVYDSNRPINTGDLPLGSENWSDKTLDVSNLPASYGDAGTEADVLFVQFNGGNVIPEAYTGFGGGNTQEGFTVNSVRVELRAITVPGPQTSKVLDVRVAGVGTGGLDYIGLAHHTLGDVGPGGLISGFEYEVVLDDNSPDGVPFSFGTDIADPKIVVVQSI